MKEQVSAVHRMQEYIQVHLDDTISMADLAGACHYSPWYAYRLFTQWLNRTPAEYIRRLRLSRSALKLRDESRKVIDIALESGYQSVDGYQRAFYRAFGCNPSEYAAKPVPIYLFTPYQAYDASAEREGTMEKVKTIFVQTVEKPARKVLVKRGQKAADYYAYCEEVGCDIWGLLLSIKSISGEPIGMWLPPQYVKEGTSVYVQGAEIALDDPTPVPEGLDVIELPAATYLMFQSEPFAEEDYEQAISEVWDAMKKYNPTLLGYEWDDTNPRIQLEPRGARGYLELAPVRKR